MKYGFSPFAMPGEDDPDRAALTRVVSEVSMASGLLSDAAAKAMGRGKILRKYVSTALRTLEPKAPAVADALLDARHLHGRHVWGSAYRCDVFLPLLQAWSLVPAAERASMSIEAILRLRPAPAGDVRATSSIPV